MRTLRLLQIFGALLTALSAPLSAQAPDFAGIKNKAEDTNPIAEENAGVIVYRGTPMIDREARVKWWREGADKGASGFQYNLGTAYDTGVGVKIDHAEAVKWYRKAAEQGFYLAQYNLGNMYVSGRGVPKDFSEAIKWWRHAADQGLDRAKYNLGVAYFNGWGVPKDYIEAYAWWNLAAISDGTAPMTPAKRWRDDLERRLPPQAQLLAQQRTKQLQQEIENREIESLKKEDQKRREEMKKGA